MKINNLQNISFLKKESTIDKKTDEIIPANGKDNVSITDSEKEERYAIYDLKGLASKTKPFTSYINPAINEYEKELLSSTLASGGLLGMFGLLIGGMSEAASLNTLLFTTGFGAIMGCLSGVTDRRDTRQGLSMLAGVAAGAVVGGAMAAGLHMGGGTVMASAAVGETIGLILKSRFLPSPPPKPGDQFVNGGAAV